MIPNCTDSERYATDPDYRSGTIRAMCEYTPAALSMARRIVKRETESPTEKAYWQGYIDYFGVRPVEPQKARIS